MRSSPPPAFDAAAFLAGTHWHQGWEIFPGVVTPGHSTVSVIMDAVQLPRDLTGRRVLDVGAWNGCASFECERRGASEVVALSTEDPDSTGFPRLAALLESERTRYVRGSIYDLDPARLGTFDVVLCFGVIYHLRYPVLGIDNLRRVARGELFVESHILDHALLDFTAGNRAIDLKSVDPRLERLALLQFYRSDELEGGPSNWFAPSASAMVGLLETAGFKVTWQTTSGPRGYYRAHVTPGLPSFLSAEDGTTTYEGLLYDVILGKLFGPQDQWRR